MFPGNSNVMGLDCHCGPHRSLFEDSASIRNARRSPWHCRPTRNPGIRSKWTAHIVEHGNELDARPSIKKSRDFDTICWYLSSAGRRFTCCCTAGIMRLSADGTFCLSREPTSGRGPASDQKNQLLGASIDLFRDLPSIDCTVRHLVP